MGTHMHVRNDQKKWIRDNEKRLASMKKQFDKKKAKKAIEQAQ